MSRIRRTLGTTSARIVAGYLLVTLVLAGAWFYSLSGPLTNTVISQQQRNLRAVAQSAALVVMDSAQEPQQIAKQLVARTDLRLTIVAADGSVLADSDFDPARMENHSDRPEIRSALDGTTGIARRTSATEGYEQIYVAVPGSLKGQRVAVRVAQSLREVGKIAARLRRFGLILLVAALTMAAFIAWRATRLAAGPVQDLTRVSRQMAGGDLAAHVPEVPADLEDLAASLATLRDQMKSRLSALDTERDTLRAALDGLPDAVLVIEAGEVVVANRAAGTVLSVPRTAIEGSRLDDIAIPASLKAAVRAQLGSTEAFAVELDPDPTGQSWRVAVAPMPSGGASTRVIVVISDITDRVNLDRVRREFVSNASHELKTPVARIKLLADSAAMAASDDDAESASAFSSQIPGEVEVLQRLVGDLLDLSRLETMPSPDSIADVRAAVDAAVTGHRSAAGRKGLSLEADFSDVHADDVFVAADPTDLAVALDNLLANAVHYTERGAITVAVRANDEDVTIEVADTGIGISAEHLSRVFERFYRADEGRSRDVGGTGLGLALVKHAAERNGGSVTVASEVGAGSVFTLSLRRHR